MSSEVTIVGAGLSGLTAAYRLKQMGIATQIYEARERPGGRVWTTHIGDSYEELGGKNFNDAPYPKAVLALIDELGLKLKSHPLDDVRPVIFDGKTYEYHALFEGAPRPTKELYQEMSGRIDSVSNMGEFIDGFLGSHAVLARLMKLLMTCFEGSSAYSLASQSFIETFLWFYQSGYELRDSLAKGEHTTIMRYVDGGNSLLIQALVDAIDRPIHFHCPLRRLCRATDGTFSLHFEGCDPVKAKRVLLTLPCTTLRDVKIEDGLLPEDQLHVIRTLQYGTNAKLLLPVECKGKSTAEVALLSNMLSWLNSDHSILTCYYGGDTGIFDAKAYEAVIQRDLPSIRQAYPNLEFVNHERRRPVAVSWINEEFSKGSYSNCGIDQFNLIHETIEAYGETIRKAFRPVQGSLFFAGEHTSVDSAATMAGAVQSGEVAARMLQNTW